MQLSRSSIRQCGVCGAVEPGHSDEACPLRAETALTRDEAEAVLYQLDPINTVPMEHEALIESARQKLNAMAGGGFL